MGSLEKLLDNKLSRWSPLSYYCLYLVWHLPNFTLLCLEQSLDLAAFRLSRHGSCSSSNMLLIPWPMLLAGRRGLYLSLELFLVLETSRPSMTGSSSSRHIKTLSPSGLLLLEERRGLRLHFLRYTKRFQPSPTSTQKSLLSLMCTLSLP